MNKNLLEKNSNKLLVICGPTATGKTNLAGQLAKKFDGELISADSRQVFIGMDIGTGKEYIEGVKIWGYDLVDPRKDYSVSKYLKFANKKITEIIERGKLPIMVGGTGLYIKGVISGIPTADVPRNDELRKTLETKNVSELFENLAEMSPTKAGSMNSSDRQNPRRLIRAIEVAQYYLTNGYKEKPPVNKFNVLTIGLTAPEEILSKKIEERVDKRVDEGIIAEIQKLLKNGVNWHNQSMFSLGYRQWRDYFEGEVEKEIVIGEWKKEERKYAKRQMTWFKKEKDINWFDITDQKYPDNVEKLASSWHNK